MTDRYAVIGNPIAHSLSPKIHRVFAAATGENVTYEALLAEDFGQECNAFFESGGLGLNVTLPFKPDAFDWVGEVDAAAQEAHAVNTIIVTESCFRGHNTDGAGLLRDLCRNLGVALERKRLLVIGAGGAVRGVLGPLIRARPASLIVANRTVDKAKTISSEFDGVEHIPLDALEAEYDVVINGTSIGMDGESSFEGLIDQSVVEGSFCYDMFYVLEGDTPFCKWSREHGAIGVAGGLGMLIEQAAEAFLLWRGIRPTTTGIASAIRD